MNFYEKENQLSQESKSGRGRGQSSRYYTHANTVKHGYDEHHA